MGQHLSSNLAYVPADGSSTLSNGAVLDMLESICGNIKRAVDCVAEVDAAHDVRWLSILVAVVCFRARVNGHVCGVCRYYCRLSVSVAKGCGGGAEQHAKCARITCARVTCVCVFHGLLFSVSSLIVMLTKASFRQNARRRH